MSMATSVQAADLDGRSAEIHVVIGVMSRSEVNGKHLHFVTGTIQSGALARTQTEFHLFDHPSSPRLTKRHVKQPCLRNDRGATAILHRRVRKGHRCQTLQRRHLHLERHPLLGRLSTAHHPKCLDAYSPRLYSGPHRQRRLPEKTSEHVWHLKW